MPIMSNWPEWKVKLESPIVEGGLRTMGLIKEGSDESPLISYVTVVKDNPETLAKAIESVQAQTYKNVEHIILDGESSDKTMEVILRYKEVIDYYASEPDEGLYDALNKIIPLCRGQLILVLNSDDWLPEDSAEYAAKHYVPDTAKMIAGSAKVVVCKDDIIYWKPINVTANSYFSVANCNHNSIYASRETYELSGPYDSSYIIAGDFKWIMTCYDLGVDIEYTDTVLVNYSLGGLSSDIYWHIEECKRIIKEKFTFLKGDEVTSLNYIFYPWKNGFKYLLAPFDAEQEINRLVEKYVENRDFVEAVDLIDNAGLNKKLSRKLRTLKFRRFLSRSPMLFKISRWIYRRFIRKVQ